MSEIGFKIIQGKVTGVQMKKINYKLLTAKSRAWAGGPCTVYLCILVTAEARVWVSGHQPAVYLCIFVIIIFLIYLFYLFIFGWVGFLLLCVGFL